MGSLPSAILIVDDEPEIRDLLKSICDEIAIPTFEADCGDSALEMIRNHPEIVGVISDILMANGNGLDLLVRVRGEGFLVPFVFLSAFETPEMMEEARSYGVTQYLTKPFEVQQVELVASLLKESGERLRTQIS